MVRYTKNILRSLLGILPLLAGFILFAPSTSHAAVPVACNNDAGDATLIRTALAGLNPDIFNELDLSGTCNLTTGGGITIQNFSNLLVKGPATLQGSTAACGTAGAFLMMNIIGTRNITIQNLTIDGGAGVVLVDSGGSFMGVNISHSRSEGLSVQGASTLNLIGAMITGPNSYNSTPNNITNSCGDGLNIGQGSTASINFKGSISNNGSAGVTVNGGFFSATGCCEFNDAGSITIENNRLGVNIGVLGGSATINGGATCSGVAGTAAIRNSTEWGISAGGAAFVGLSGNVTVENNQTAPVSPSALIHRAGIYGAYGATIFITPGATIKTTNGGAGVLVDALSKLRLGTFPVTPPSGGTCTPPSFADVSITQNGSDGVQANHMSFIEIISTTSIANNTGKDAVCDSTSLLDGVTSGIVKNKCK